MNSRVRALTLVEVLLALAIGALLTLLVQVFVVRTYLIHRTLAQRDVKWAQSQLPFRVLAADLANLPQQGTIALHNEELVVTTLQALAVPEVGARRLVRVRYTLRTHSGQFGLHRYEQLAADDSPWHSDALLVSSVRAVRWEIYDGKEWYTKWPPPDPRPPAALRITLEGTESSVAQRIILLTALPWRRHDAP